MDGHVFIKFHTLYRYLQLRRHFLHHDFLSSFSYRFARRKPSTARTQKMEKMTRSASIAGRMGGEVGCLSRRGGRKDLGTGVGEVR